MIILSASLEYRNANNRKRINFYFNNESGDTSFIVRFEDHERGKLLLGGDALQDCPTRVPRYIPRHNYY